MTILLRFLNFLSGGLCHQQASRSFGIDGLCMPLCSRCTGIYIGFLFSLVAIIIIERRVKGEFPSLKIILTAACVVLLMGLDVVSSFLKIFNSNNYIRFTTGFLTGWFLALVMLQLKNILMWNKLVRVPYLNNKRSFFIWILCGICIIAAFMLSFGKILIFWEIISITGMIIFITLATLILFFGTYRRLTNNIKSWKSYIVSFAAGIVFSIGVLSLLSMARKFLM